MQLVRITGLFLTKLLNFVKFEEQRLNAQVP